MTSFAHSLCRNRCWKEPKKGHEQKNTGSFRDWVPMVCTCVFSPLFSNASPLTDIEIYNNVTKY